jgi:hypothetical protein
MQQAGDSLPSDVDQSFLVDAPIEDVKSLLSPLNENIGAYLNDLATTDAEVQEAVLQIFTFFSDPEVLACMGQDDPAGEEDMNHDHDEFNDPMKGQYPEDPMQGAYTKWACDDIEGAEWIDFETLEDTVRHRQLRSYTRWDKENYEYVDVPGSKKFCELEKECNWNSWAIKDKDKCLDPPQELYPTAVFEENGKKMACMECWGKWCHEYWARGSSRGRSNTEGRGERDKGDQRRRDDDRERDRQRERERAREREVRRPRSPPRREPADLRQQIRSRERSPPRRNYPVDARRDIAGVAVDRDRRNRPNNISPPRRRSPPRDRRRSPNSNRDLSPRRQDRPDPGRPGILTFSQIREQQQREKDRENERRRRARDRQLQQIEEERLRKEEERRRAEEERLHRERDELRREREKLEREKQELMKFERERQRLERERLQREKEDLERLRRQQQQSRLEENRRAPKRPPPNDDRDPYYDERKRR